MNPSINEPINQWIGGYMVKWMDRWMNGWIYSQTNESTVECMKDQGVSELINMIDNTTVYMRSV